MEFQELFTVTWLLLLSNRHTHDLPRVISRHSISLDLQTPLIFYYMFILYMYINKKKNPHRIDTIMLHKNCFSFRWVCFVLVFLVSLSGGQVINTNVTWFFFSLSGEEERKKKKKRLGLWHFLPCLFCGKQLDLDKKWVPLFCVVCICSPCRWHGICKIMAVISKINI